MKTHYIFLPNDLKTGEVCSFTSLRHLCKHFSLTYANVNYGIKRKTIFDTGNGTVVRARHFEGVKRGRSF